MITTCINRLYYFYNRLKSLKKEINMAEQKSEERKQKREEIKNVSATKPKRLSRYQYPLTLKVRKRLCWA